MLCNRWSSCSNAVYRADSNVQYQYFCGSACGFLSTFSIGACFDCANLHVPRSTRLHATGRMHRYRRLACTVLPVYDELIEETLEQAVDVNFGSTSTRVLSAEHLAAIMLETGRPKDHARLVQFFEYDVVNEAILSDIVSRHSLTAQWESFQKRFLNETD